MTIRLKEILSVLDKAETFGDLSVRLTGVTHDSRRIESGCLFVAISGEKLDGHDFIGPAVRAGAVAVLAETVPDPEFRYVPWVTVSDTRKALGPVSALVYEHPTDSMVLVGITGTSGKTTLTYLLEAIVKAGRGIPGVVGTISYRWVGRERQALHTTPEASDLQLMLREMADAGVTHGLMEVSSHGLDLGRLDGCHFDLGVFTNLTQDHLDYHGNLERYFLAKRILFDRLLASSPKKSPTAIVNFDDPYGKRLCRDMPGLRVIRFGTSPECDIRPLDFSFTADGMVGTIQTPLGPLSVRSRLTGSFNLLNILAAIAVAGELGIPEAAISNGIESVEVVPGRLERIPSDKGTIFVDYAHKPDALKKVLDALQTIRSGRIITVIGCGGDRDKQKRPMMGMEAAAGSDFVVVTSDNPRTEEPLEIIRQVEQGVRRFGFFPYEEEGNHKNLKNRHYRVIPDRREAIVWALRRIENGDILLVAGKGHETYQEINGIRYPFDDREVLREELKKTVV
ncbi:MAG TPA: UDP-N-acetylmuramoyl-L-alanyl-D-glutamate--2,6-diaminopimelate ligase [Desulfomonilaceae bacterium]|nr:UDP-N-acetylmuramoyl-L-alanyl-D-glutamate--2,6-diaminopimelate ligase [Desulfomonilaceae bacterium]